MSFSQESLEKLATDYTAAWNSKVPENVANCHVASSQIIINRGEPSKGHAELTAMAAGFHADVPDLVLTCEGIRSAGQHVIYLWRFTGHHAETGNPLDIAGWEEWELNENMKITSSLGWFDAEDYQRQVEGG